MRGLNRDQIVKIDRLTGCKNFVRKRTKFIFNAFVDLKPVERFENGSDMQGFRSLNNSTSKRVLDLLQPVKLIVWKAIIERLTVIKFRMDNGGCNGAGCFEARSSALAERPRDASCLSVVSFNSTTRQARSSIIGYFGFRFTAAYN